MARRKKQDTIEVSKENELQNAYAMMNDFNSILTGLMMDRQGVNPKNKINSLEFIREQIRADVLTLDRQLASRMYMQFGICQSIAEVPVFDAFRNGFSLKLYERKQTPEQTMSPNIDNKPPQGILKKIKGMFGFKENEQDVNKEEEKKSDKKDEKCEDRQTLIDHKVVKAREEWDKIAKQIDDETKKTTSEFLYSASPRWKIKAVEMKAKESRLFDSFKQALIWSRVFGGAGIIINLPDKAGQPDEPIKWEKITKGDRVEFIVADCWELMGDSATSIVGSVDPYVNWLSDCPFMYQGVKIHKSRVLVFNGKMIPSLMRPLGRGWGMSYYEHLARTLTSTWKAQNVRAELLDSAKTDIFKFKGLNTQATNPLLNDGLRRRMSMAQKQKNYDSSVSIDGEDDYIQKQMTFAGFPEMQEQDRYDNASDTRIMLTKLYGMTPAGFSSGDADRQTYEDMVKSEVQNPTLPNLITAYKILTLCAIGEDLDVDGDFNPLSKSDPMVDIEIKKKKYDLCMAGIAQGKLTNGQVAEYLNEHNIFEGIEVIDELPYAPDPVWVRSNKSPLMNK